MALKFYCKAGYDLVGNSAAQCTSTGEWSHPIPACVPWPCDSPPVPLHGQIQSIEIHSNLIVASVRCDRGFQLSGSNLTCDPSGKWKGQLECGPQICPIPQSLNQKKVQSNVNYDATYRYGDRIDFHCFDGFVLDSPNASVECSENGQWNGTIPSCVPVQCPSLAAPLYGSITSSDGSSVGHRATVSCDEGYRLDGSAQLICLSDGRWSHQVAVCVALYCRQPAQVDNGWMVVRGVQLGDVVSYSCRSGFHLTGFHRIQLILLRQKSIF